MQRCKNPHLALTILYINTLNLSYKIQYCLKVRSILHQSIYYLTSGNLMNDSYSTKHFKVLILPIHPSREALLLINGAHS